MPPENPTASWSARSVELESLEQLLRARNSRGRGHPEIGAVEREDLARREREVEIRPLRHDADQALDGDAILPDVVVADEGPARRSAGRAW